MAFKGCLKIDTISAWDQNFNMVFWINGFLIFLWTFWRWSNLQLKWTHEQRDGFMFRHLSIFLYPKKVTPQFMMGLNRFLAETSLWWSNTVLGSLDGWIFSMRSKTERSAEIGAWWISGRHSNLSVLTRISLGWFTKILKIFQNFNKWGQFSNYRLRR